MAGLGDGETVRLSGNFGGVRCELMLSMLNKYYIGKGVKRGQKGSSGVRVGLRGKGRRRGGFGGAAAFAYFCGVIR